MQFFIQLKRFINNNLFDDTKIDVFSRDIYTFNPYLVDQFVRFFSFPIEFTFSHVGFYKHNYSYSDININSANGELDCILRYINDHKVKPIVYATILACKDDNLLMFQLFSMYAFDYENLFGNSCKTDTNADIDIKWTILGVACQIGSVNIVTYLLNLLKRNEIKIDIDAIKMWLFKTYIIGNCI